jgi:hypothetical protein
MEPLESAELYYKDPGNGSREETGRAQESESEL